MAAEGLDVHKTLISQVTAFQPLPPPPLPCQQKWYGPLITYKVPAYTPEVAASIRLFWGPVDGGCIATGSCFLCLFGIRMSVRLYEKGSTK